MPQEVFALSPKEMEAVQRLADAKKVDADEVLQFVAVMALMEYPRDEEDQQ